MQEAAKQHNTTGVQTPTSGAPATTYNNLRPEAPSTLSTSRSMSSSGCSGRTDSSSASSGCSRSASISSDSESSDSSYDSADPSRSSSIDLESRAAVNAASNALSRAKFGRDIQPGCLRVLRIKLICIFIAIAVSSVTSLRFLESIGMFQSEKLSVTTMNESYRVYSDFVSNESQKIQAHIDREYHTNLAKVNHNCKSLLATGAHRQNHTATTATTWVSNFCPSLIDRVWDSVQIPPKCRTLLQPFADAESLETRVDPECVMCWINRNGTQAYLMATVKPENYSSDYKFQQGTLRLGCFYLQAELLASMTTVLGEVNQEETPGSRQNAVKKRMNYDKEYIKKHMDFFKDMELTRKNILKDLDLKFNDLNIAFAKLEGLNLEMKLKLNAELASLKELRANLKDFQVSTDFMRTALSFIPDVIPNAPSLPDVSMPDMPDMPDMPTLPKFNMPEVSIPSGFEDYSPPDIEGHVFSEGEIVSRYLQRKSEVASRSRSIPKSSMKAPKLFSILSDMFGWIEGSLSLLVFSDFVFRFASCARYIASILRVRKRDMVSASTKCRAVVSMMCSSLPAVFIFGFLIFLLSQIVIAASNSSIMTDLTEEVEIQCHNQIVVASDKKRAAYAETLSSVRLQCDMDLSTINENIVKFNDVLANAISKTKAYEIENYVSDSSWAKPKIFDVSPIECTRINISTPFREPPQLASTVNLTNPTLMESGAFNVPSCRDSKEVHRLRREILEFAVNIRRQILSRIVVAVLLTIAGWCVIGAIRNWFWLELTEGYESDRTFGDDDVLRKAKSMRRSAIIELLLTIPLCVVACLIGTQKLEPTFLYGGAA